MKDVMHGVLIAVGGLIVVGLIGNAMATWGSKAATRPEISIPSMSVRELLREYNHDPVAAGSKYANRSVRLSGNVALIRDYRELSAMFGHARPFDPEEKPIVFMAGDDGQGMVAIIDADIAARVGEHNDISVTCQIVHYGLVPVPLVSASHCNASTLREGN
jgi:hypothetical protein